MWNKFSLKYCPKFILNFVSCWLSPLITHHSHINQTQSITSITSSTWSPLCWYLTFIYIVVITLHFYISYLLHIILDIIFDSCWMNFHWNIMRVCFILCSLFVISFLNPYHIITSLNWQSSDKIQLVQFTYLSIYNWVMLNCQNLIGQNRGTFVKSLKIYYKTVSIVHFLGWFDKKCSYSLFSL